MTLAELQALAHLKGFTVHAAALAFNLTDKDGKKLELDGTDKLTREQIEEYLTPLPNAPFKVSFTEKEGKF